MSNILLYHSLPYSPELGPLIEHRAWLAVPNLSNPPASSPPSTEGYRRMPAHAMLSMKALGSRPRSA